MVVAVALAPFLNLFQRRQQSYLITNCFGPVIDVYVDMSSLLTMMVPSTIGFLFLICPQLVESLRLDVNHHTPCRLRYRYSRISRPGVVPTRRRRWRWGHSSHLRYYGVITTTPTLFLHYDDFTDLMHDNESTTNSEQVDSNNDLDWTIPPIPSLFPRLQQTLETSPISYSSSITNHILQQITSAGFVDDNDIIQFARGFLVREEELSQILIHDFGWKALDAHRARVGIISLVRKELSGANDGTIVDESPTLTDAAQPIMKSKSGSLIEQADVSTSKDVLSSKELQISVASEDKLEVSNGIDDSVKPMLWKSVHVNDKQKQRMANSRKTNNRVQSGDEGNPMSTDKNSYNYGLLRASSGDDTDRKVYATLYAELDSFWSYMTVPQTSAVSDAIIRDQTAKVYLTHARLFLGWIVDARDVLDGGSHQIDEVLNEDIDGSETQITSSLVSSFSGISSLYSSSTTTNNMAQHDVRKQVWKNVLERKSATNTSTQNKKEILRHDISLHDIFPNSQTESASPVLQYILWLRVERGISPNYEANM